MPRNALRCLADITLHAVTCPGVWLPRRDDVYVSICMFGQVRRTLLTSPVFPLLFHEKFCFDKVFYTAFEPSQVAGNLENHWVTIEVVQMSDIYDGGRLLASFEGSVRDFLYPYPSYSPCYGTQDRELLLNRSMDFPGISPKLEFSTRTVIEEAGSYCLDDDLVYTPRTVARGRSRSRSRSRARARSPRGKTYHRPTVASLSRSRSLSPSRRLADLCLDDTEVGTDTDFKPPFVVRKCDSGKLIGRMPGSPGPSIYGRSRQRRKSLPSGIYDDDDLYNIRPVTPVTKYSLDDNLSSLTISRPYSTSYRATSPYRYSLYDRHYYPNTADVINTRVERAIARNKSLERLDRLERSSNTRYYDALTDLELDLALARARTRRTYYY